MGRVFRQFADWREGKGTQDGAREGQPWWGWARGSGRAFGASEGKARPNGMTQQAWGEGVELSHGKTSHGKLGLITQVFDLASFDLQNGPSEGTS